VTDPRPAVNAAQAARWNGESGRFWITHRERQLAGHRRLIPHLFSAAGISAGELVLDIGCGCGATTIAAARRAGGPGLHSRLPDPRAGTTGGAVGLDLSRPMLQVARRLAAASAVPAAVFAQCDAQGCPLQPGSCDVAISSFGVMFFDDPAEAFASIATAVRPGGRLAFLCWQDDSRNELLALPVRPFKMHGPPPAPAIGELFTDPRQVTDLLSRTGWTDIEVTALTEPAWVGSDVSDVMRYVRGMPAIRRLRNQLASQGTAEHALAIVAEQYAARQRADGIWVRAAAWLVTARCGR
jgi:ubiquinone/menaquinone biosynthesis C-methylase UbiE